MDQIKILPTTSGSSISGINSAVLAQGVALFDNLVFSYAPGARNIQFVATSSAIDQSKVSMFSLPTDNSISVSFRF